MACISGRAIGMSECAATGSMLVGGAAATAAGLLGWRCCNASSVASQALFAQQAVQLEEWDIVLYDSPGGTGAALGRVASVAADEVQVERLEEDAANQVGPLPRHPAAAFRQHI